ncbi:MAG: DMT family transporter [Nanoarchaeota archaeon]|nr:DMT family transporter [Nanoarchaeota archaeon]
MKRGVMFALCTAIISGVSIFLNAFGVQGINPYVFTGFKNVIVAVFLFSIILLFKNFKQLKNLTFKDWKQLVLIGLIGGSIPFLLFFKGLQLSTGSQGSFIHKTLFIWVSILGVIFLKEKLSKKVLIPALVLLFGNFLLLNLNSFSFNFGNLLILIATLFWGVEIIIAKKVLKKLNSNIVAFGRMFFGSVFILIFLLFTGQVSLVGSLGFSQVMWVLITSVFLFGYVFTWYKAIKFTKVSVATSVLLVGSVITTLLSFVFLDKMISLSQLFGLVFLVVGVVWVIKLEKFQFNISIAKP